MAVQQQLPFTEQHAAANAETKTIDPIPLNKPQGSDAVFPVAALGDIGSQAAAALHKHVQAPVGLCGQAILGAMSASVSAWGYVSSIMDGAKHPISLYLLTVASTGERKSTVDDCVQTGLRSFEHHMKLELASLQCDVDGTDIGELDATIVANEPTYEGLLRVMAKGPGFAVLSNDDAAGFFGGYSMSNDQRLKTISGLSKMYSGASVSLPRAGGNGLYVAEVPLTTSLMFQPSIVSKVYGDEMMLEQGFLARFLPCFPVSTMGTRLHKSPDASTLESLAKFDARVDMILEKLKEQGRIKLAPQVQFRMSLPNLPLSGEAHKVLVSFYNGIETGLKPGGEYSDICGFAGRATENATRIAAVITLFDDPEAKEVNVEAAKAGLDLMRFYMNQYSHLVDLGLNQKEALEAGELGRWLVNEVGPGGIISANHVLQHGPSAYRKKAGRDAAIRVLEQHHWVKSLKNVEIEGKNCSAYQINPAIGKALGRG